MTDAKAGVYLSFGSNVMPVENVMAAVCGLGRRVRVLRVSTVYEVPPLDRPEQDSYLNGVLEVATSLTARQVKHEVLRPIEAALGRRRTADRYAARTIDLDLILFRDACIAEPDMVVPDPDLKSRPFLAHPLLELTGDVIIPGLGSLAYIARRLPTTGMMPREDLTAALREVIGHESRPR